MRGTDIATLVLPVIGLWLLIEGTSGLVAGLYWWSRNDDAPWLATMLLFPAFISLAGAALLLLRPRTLARRLFPDEPAADPSPVAQDWQALAVSLMGLFMVATAIPSLVGSATEFAFALAAWRKASDLTDDISATMFAQRPDWSPILEALSQILIGAYLFGAARGISRFWNDLGPDDTMRAFKRLAPALLLMVMAAVAVWMLSTHGPNSCAGVSVGRSNQASPLPSERCPRAT